MSEQVLQRSPAMPRGGSAAERIITVSTDLFYREGIRGVGVDRLISEAGVAKATFYAHYPSKQDLVARYLANWTAGWMAWFSEFATATPGRSDAHVDAPFDFLAVLVACKDFRGCALANALAQSGPEGGVERVICRDHARAFRDRLAALARQAGLADPGLVAGTVAMAFDGAVSGAVYDDDPAGVVERGRAMARAALASL